MAARPLPSTGQILERLATQLHSVAFEFDYGRQTPAHSDERIAEVERIVSEARAAVRGRPPIDRLVVPIR